MDCVRIGYLSTMYHTSHILKGQNWLEQELRVRPHWQLFGTGPAMVEAFLRNELDLGYLGLPPAMIGIDRGLRIKCVAGGHIEGTVMIGRPASKALRGADDMAGIIGQYAGQSLGAPSQGSIHDVILRHLLQTHGLSNVTVKNYPWADLIPEAIAEGEIQGAVGTPALAVLGRHYYNLPTIVAPACLWPCNPSYGIVASAALLACPEFIEGFLVLHERACNLMQHQARQAAFIISREIKAVADDFVIEVLQVSPRYCAALPDAYIDAAMAFVPVLQSMGYLHTALSRQVVFETVHISKVHPDQPHYTQPRPAPAARQQ